MSLDKAVEHKKEHRKPFFGAKAIDATCRNHGSCEVCCGNRLHSTKKRELESDENRKEDSEEKHNTFPLPNGISISTWAKVFTTRMKALADGYRVDGEDENGEYIWEKCDRNVARHEAEQMCHQMFDLMSTFAASGNAQDIVVNNLLNPDKRLLFYKKCLELIVKEKDRLEKEFYCYDEEDEDEDEEEDDDCEKKIGIVLVLSPKQKGD